MALATDAMEQETDVEPVPRGDPSTRRPFMLDVAVEGQAYQPALDRPGLLDVGRGYGREA